MKEFQTSLNEANSQNSQNSQSVELVKSPNRFVYSGLAGDFVKAIIPHSEADPIAILVQFLACFGNVIGLNPHFKVEASVHALKIFPILVGQSSKGRKGTSWGYVKKIFSSLDGDWYENSIVSGLSSGEGLINAINSLEESELGKRLLVVESEFASVLKVMRREGNILSATIRNAWDDKYLRNLTKQNPLSAKDAHITVIGHITIEELLKYITETEIANGFGNRFLWVLTQRSKYLPNGGEFQKIDFAPLYKRLIEAVSFSRRIKTITKSDGANNLWCTKYLELSEGEVGLVGALLGRAEAYVLRFACLYALLDCSDKIEVSHMFSALGLWEYCENSTRYIFGNSTGNPIADKILIALKNNSRGYTKTQLYGLFNRHIKQKNLNTALDYLKEKKLIRSSEAVSNGVYTEVWEYYEESAN